jgi:hypothetical protein
VPPALLPGRDRAVDDREGITLATSAQYRSDKGLRNVAFRG